MLALRTLVFSVCLVAVPHAMAVPIIYSGFDAGSMSLATSPNATAAASRFDSAVPSAEIDNFATSVNPDYTRTKGDHSFVKRCAVVYAYNTTPGGGGFICDNLSGGIEFSFPEQHINAFGLYLTSYRGVGKRVRVLYDDFSADRLWLPEVDRSIDAGTLFFGFEDLDRRIIAIEFRTGRSGFAYDDLRYRFAPEITDPGDPVSSPDPVSVSEPSTFALLGIGFFVLGASRLRRRLSCFPRRSDGSDRV